MRKALILFMLTGCATVLTPSSDDRPIVGQLKRGCAERDLESCTRLAILFENGDEGTERNLTAAAELYRKACAKGFGGACTNLGLFYAKGRVVRKDLAEAVRLFRKSCDESEGSGCHALALQYLKGEGVPKDEPKAIQLLTVACQQDYASACWRLGLILEPSKPDESVQLLTQACGKKKPGACVDLGNLLLSGRGIKRSPELAARAFTAACDLNYEPACTRLHPTEIATPPRADDSM